MNTQLRWIVLSVLLMAIVTLVACNGESSTNEESVTFKRTDNDVYVHELADPDKLNAITSSSANSTYVQANIFMYLVDVNKEKAIMNPSLAIDLPKVTAIEQGPYAGGMRIEYEIRPEAVWDNGEPVTAHDVDFTMKAAKNPAVDAEHLRPYLDFINEIVIDPENPKKFTFLCKTKYFGAIFSSGGQVTIMPEYIYDPAKIMRKFTIQELTDPQEKAKLRGNPDIISFAKDFNSEKFQRENGFVVGCGPYEFVEWITSQRIVLKKKKDWWGSKLAGEVVNFEAYPEKIVYEIVNDWTTTVTAMKDQSIDVARGVQPKDFIDLQKNKDFNDHYNLFSPNQFAYTYIGMNLKSPKLSDVRVRKALAHVVDRAQIIDILLYGLADKTDGPFNPVKEYYNPELPPYNFDLDKAKALLDEAGWKDNDNDGVRDKMIDGKKRPLKLEFKYNTGNDVRENIGLFFKENAKKVGIEVEIVAKEWTVFIDETKNHNFEVYCSGWVQDPIMDDPKQLWHTDSYNGGSNYVGFGDVKSDLLIESIRKELVDTKRNEYYKQFQARIHGDVPYIFLYTPKNLIAISKRFDNANAYIARPGYNERELKLRSNKVLAAEK